MKRKYVMTQFRNLRELLEKEAYNKEYTDYYGGGKNICKRFTKFTMLNWNAGLFLC